MKKSNTTLSSSIDAVAKDWDFSGQFVVLKNEEILHQKSYGYADRENNVSTQADSLYLLHSESSFFVKLCILMLVDQGSLKLTDKLSKFIPEYKHSHLMTIENLMKSQSGIQDFFYSHLMVEHCELESYKALSEYDRVRSESHLYNQNYNFNTAFQLIGEKELEYVPGTSDLGESESNSLFLSEVIRRLTGMSVIAFEKKMIFEPLGMTVERDASLVNTISYIEYKETELVRTPLESQLNGLLSVNIQDMTLFLKAIGTRQLLSEKMWQKVLKYDSEGNGLIFANANGYECADISFYGYGFYLYFNHSTGVAFANLCNEEQTFRFINSNWHYFRKDSREAVDSAFTFPVNTKMVKLNKENFWNALIISVEEDQVDYVLDAKSSVASSLFYKTKKAYVQMEGNRVIGLLVLDIDKKKNHYNIDIIQIDKRFQNRGYGKLMLAFAIDTLKAAGAEVLEIGVNRHNIGAQKIYMAAGFTPKSIYEGGMHLHMKMSETKAKPTTETTTEITKTV